MPTSDARGDDPLSDAGCDGAFNDGRDRIHGSDHFGLELRRDVQPYLLEEIFRGTKATDYKDVL